MPTKIQPNIGAARGALGARALPRLEKKIGGPNVQGKVVSAPPGRARVQILRRFLPGGGGLEGGSG